ncbi:hypothetical protein LEP1GSC018_2709 [Leptospira kirschneri str. 2008720114]|nr:hypothetical protein LEP1GSC018_2709 [Leptospira kirschneri str. 2008720114]
MRPALKEKYRITFFSYNLSTGAESAVRQRRIRPDSLSLDVLNWVLY